MALRIFYDKDADLGRLAGKTVAVIGYGSQGHAHAQNLKSSGVDVLVGLRKDSPSCAKAEGAGLRVVTVGEAAREADVVMMTLPDETTADIYREQIEPFLQPGDYLAVAHGFNIHFGAIQAAEGRERLHGGAQGPRPHRARALRAGARRAVAGRRPRRSLRRHAPDRARLRQGDRRRAGPGSSRPPSGRRPRPTCSASRRCSAGA